MSSRKQHESIEEVIVSPRDHCSTSVRKENENVTLTDSESDSFTVASPFSPGHRRSDRTTITFSTPKPTTDDELHDEVGCIYWDCFSPANRRQLTKIKNEKDSKNITELVKCLVPNKHYSPISGSRLTIPLAKPSHSKRLERQRQKKVLESERRAELLKECEFIEKQFLKSGDKKEENNICQCSNENNPTNNEELWSDDDCFENDSFVLQASHLVDSCSCTTKIPVDIESGKTKEKSAEEKNDLWCDDSCFQNNSFVEKATQLVETCSADFTHSAAEGGAASSPKITDCEILSQTQKRTKQTINRNRAVALRKRSEYFKKRRLKFQ